MRYRLFLLLVLLPTLSSPARAGVLFGRKKERPDPKQRVPELLAVLRTDKDADKRSRAAEELRNFDPHQFPEILPALIETLQNDKTPGVRIDCVQSLSKIRPVSPLAGQALEHAVANDPSMRVRLQARSALLMYHWAGYRSGKKADLPPLNPTAGPPTMNREGDRPGDAGPVVPPVIDTATPAQARPRFFSRPAGSLRPVPTAPTTPVPTTKEPPLAPPLPETTPKPAPVPPAVPPSAPSEGPRLP